MRSIQPFHVQLKRERERRGWSQKYLAELLDCDDKTINRWESGQNIPRSYYQQDICNTFGKTPQEFGLVKIHEEEASTSHYEDWGEAPRGGSFYGRTNEMEHLKQLVQEQHCRVVAVLGMGGVGKSTLAAKVAEDINGSFDIVYWRALYNAPSLEHVLRQCIQSVTGSAPDLSATEDEILAHFFSIVQRQRCLLILDNLESLLQSGQYVGKYRAGYDNYGRFLRRFAETPHQGCLIVTGRERPHEMTLLEGEHAIVRSLVLTGVNSTDGRKILQHSDLAGTSEHWEQFVAYYEGNPMALKIASGTIRSVFDGEIAAFVQEQKLTFGKINEVLQEQFARLSPLEREVMYWLAIEREPVTRDVVQENMLSTGDSLLEAFNSLVHRYLVEKHEQKRFSLQPVIMEYTVAELIKRAENEFPDDAKHVWTHQAFMKAQTREYIRESQRRLLLDPIAQHLLERYGREGLARLLARTLDERRKDMARPSSYLAGNILHLILHLKYDPARFNFSHLTIRQAYLQDSTLPDVNFVGSYFQQVIFASTFGAVLSSTFSPQIGELVVGTSDGAINFYHAQHGHLLRTFNEHTDSVWSLAFNQDGTLLASASDDQTIRIWDLATNRCIHLLTRHHDRVRSLAFSPAGQLLVSGSEDRTLRVWDVEHGRSLCVLKGHTDRVWTLAIHPSRRLIASGGTDGTVRLWNLDKGECLRIFSEHTGWIRAVAFSPDGTLLASASDDQTIRLWDVQQQPQDWHCIRTLREHSQGVWCLAFHPDGERLASGSEDQAVRVWQIQSGACLTTFQGHFSGIRTVAFSSDGALLASGGDDLSIRLWDVTRNEGLRTLRGHTNRIWSVGAAGRDAFVSSSDGGRIHLWNLQTMQMIRFLSQREHGVRMVVGTTDGTLLASGGEDQTVRLWSCATGRCLHILQGHRTWVRAVAFREDGKLLASGCENGMVRIWQVDHIGKPPCLHLLTGHTSWIRALAFHPQAPLLASGGDDQTIRLWSTVDGHCQRILAGHDGRIRSLAFSSDGRWLISGGEDQVVRVWDVDCEVWLTVCRGHTGRVLSVAVHPYKMLFASSSEDLTIRLWDGESGTCQAILQGHTARIRSLMFAFDGTRLISGSDDGCIKVWDIQKGICLQTLINERPYERMNIRDATGLTEALRESLLLLGACER